MMLMDAVNRLLVRFRETEDVSSSTATGVLPISETKFCDEHENMVSRGLNGYPVYYPVNI